MSATPAQAPDTIAALAAPLARRVAATSSPRSPQAHLIEGTPDTQLLIVNGTRLFSLPPALAAEFEAVLAAGDENSLTRLIATSGLEAPAAIDDQPLQPMPAHALSLAIAQKCNLGCGYCYAQQGGFGGAAKSMTLDTARAAIDLLLREAEPGGRVNLAFLGGEPLVNRKVLQQATDYAADQAAQRGVGIGFSMTTNGTMLTVDDADFFERHGFAITVSLDGDAENHDRLRPFKNGRGSYARIVERVAPLLARQRKMQVSARVTVTPSNIELPETLDLFVDMGFHSVGFSPLLRASNNQSELDGAGLTEMLEGMIACGLSFEQHVLRGRRYPFLNMVNAMRELHRGTHRPYPCGAGAGYFGVSADGDLSACHRFVGDDAGQFGTLTTGIDREKQAAWLGARHVHQQSPCSQCWARYLCGGGCHHEVLARGRSACDYIRGWLHYTIQAHGRLAQFAPDWFAGAAPIASPAAPPA